MPDTAIKERPIICTAESVRGILDNLKRQTRRVIKPQPVRVSGDWDDGAEAGDHVIYRGWPTKLVESNGRNKAAAGILTPLARTCLYGKPGDRLWVRETWGVGAHWDSTKPRDLPQDGPDVEYKAGPTFYLAHVDQWRSPYHMPRWACRLILEVTGVRVERVQDISDDDCEAEGIFNASGLHLAHCSRTHFHPDHDCQCGDNSPQDEFAKLWDSINGKRDGCSWEANPWVWVVTFRKVDL